MIVQWLHHSQLLVLDMECAFQGNVIVTKVKQEWSNSYFLFNWFPVYISIGWTGIGHFVIENHVDCGINIQAVIIITTIVFITDIIVIIFIIYYFIHRLTVSKLTIYDVKISFPLYLLIFDIIFGVLLGTYVIYPQSYEGNVIGNSIWYTLLVSVGWPWFIAAAIDYSKNYLQFLQGMYIIMSAESKQIMDEKINSLNFNMHLLVFILIFFIPLFGLLVDQKKYYYIIGIIYFNSLGMYMLYLFINAILPLFNLVDELFSHHVHNIQVFYPLFISTGNNFNLLFSNICALYFTDNIKLQYLYTNQLYVKFLYLSLFLAIFVDWSIILFDIIESWTVNLYRKVTKHYRKFSCH